MHCATLNFGGAPRSQLVQEVGRSGGGLPAIKDAHRPDRSAQAVFADDIQGRVAVIAGTEMLRGS
jgi:hypothetical protein